MWAHTRAPRTHPPRAHHPRHAAAQAAAVAAKVRHLQAGRGGAGTEEFSRRTRCLSGWQHERAGRQAAAELGSSRPRSAGPTGRPSCNHAPCKPQASPAGPARCTARPRPARTRPPRRRPCPAPHHSAGAAGRRARPGRGTAVGQGREEYLGGGGWKRDNTGRQVTAYMPGSRHSCGKGAGVGEAGSERMGA